MYRGPDISAFVARVRDTATTAGETAMAEGDDYAKQLLATPYPPASSPGEPPHKRTGALQDGVQHLVYPQEDGVTFAQGFSREGGDPNVPTYLEFGTGKMKARPFRQQCQDETAPKVHAALADALRSLSTD